LEPSGVGPLGLTALEVEAAYIPAIENIVTNVVAKPMPNGKGWLVTGDSTTGTDLVAKFARSIYENKRGEIVVRHTRIDVDSYYRWGGYAKALLSANLPFYQRIGAEYIELDAAGDGTLVWPRYGWSLHGASIADVQTEIVYTYSMRHKTRPPDSFTLPIFGPDILALEDHEGNRIGLETLKGLAVSSREISMRLHLKQDRPLAVLRQRGII
jgi:hypothetical protein